MGKKKKTPSDFGVKCCPECGTDKIKFNDPDLEGYVLGTDIGVVYGEELTGSYSWDDNVIPYVCEKGHVFYVSVDPSRAPRTERW